MVSIRQNAQKIVFIAKEYPEHTVEDVVQLLEMPAIDINTAIWYAEDQGWLTLHDDRTITTNFDQEWELGEIVEGLMERLQYAFEYLGRTDQDFEEFTLNQWASGYPKHDLLIALKRLMDLNVIATYTLIDTDGEGKDSEYTFYCLSKNVGKEFGRKQFKDQEQVEIKKDELIDDGITRH